MEKAVNFYQSTIVQPTNSFEIKSQKFSKKNEAICSKNFGDLEKSTLLFVKDEIILDIKNLIENLSLKNSNPPFFNTTFSLWRKQQYEKLQNFIKYLSEDEQTYWKEQFSKEIDQLLYERFLPKLDQPYYNLVLYQNYNIPKKIKTDELWQKYELQSELKKLAKNIASWCIQLEITSDLIDKASLYGFQISQMWKKDGSIQSNLKSKFSADEKQLKKIFLQANLVQNKDDIVKSSTLYGMKKVQGIVDGKQIGWGTGLTILYQLTTKSIFPWQAALFGLASSLIAPKLDDAIVYLQKEDKAKELDLLSGQFQKLSKELSELNQKSNNLINQGLKINNEANSKDFLLLQLELKQVIQKILLNTEDFNEEQIYNPQTQEVFVQKQLNEEWTIVDEVETFESQDKDFIVCSDKKENI